ncbi:MAG: pilus assembly protein PilM [Chthoniobacterales bacterium]|nr:pilus assembly protein PilM [Chthoniobacterales bacterium]
MFLLPAAHGWNLVRKAAHNGAWDVRAFASLDETAAVLNGDTDVVLGLPVNAILAQRLRLPTVEASEFSEIVRIQVEKTLPYPPEEVTTDFEVIDQTEEGSTVSVIAVHNEKLSELAAPLVSRGIIPSQVTVYAAQRATTHAATGRALLIYPEAESLVCAISEQGKVGFTRSLDGKDATHLRRDLPQVTLSAQLQGIDTSDSAVLLDESLFESRETVQALFAKSLDLIAVEAPPAVTKLNLLPDSWRQRRANLVTQARWKKRLLWAGGAYGALLLLFGSYVLLLRLEAGRLDRRVERDAPKTEFIRTTEAKWKALAPAIDPNYYPIEVLLGIFESLPSPDVQITQFNQSARQISVDGEAKSAAQAYEFADKVKKNPALKAFQFEMAAPRILPNEHAQFRLEGKPR